MRKKRKRDCRGEVKDLEKADRAQNIRKIK